MAEFIFKPTAKFIVVEMKCHECGASFYIGAFEVPGFPNDSDPSSDVVFSKVYEFRCPLCEQRYVLSLGHSVKSGIGRLTALGDAPNPFLVGIKHIYKDTFKMFY